MFCGDQSHSPAMTMYDGICFQDYHNGNQIHNLESCEHKVNPCSPDSNQFNPTRPRDDFKCRQNIWGFLQQKYRFKLMKWADETDVYSLVFKFLLIFHSSEAGNCVSHLEINEKLQVAMKPVTVYRGNIMHLIRE